MIDSWTELPKVRREIGTDAGDMGDAFATGFYVGAALIVIVVVIVGGIWLLFT